MLAAQGLYEQLRRASGARRWGPQCRGILITGNTNTARTLMIEALLRHATHGAVFVQSCGSEHVPGGGPAAHCHPMARVVMKELGADIDALMTSVGSKSAIATPAYLSTFDVLIRVVNVEPLSTSALATRRALQGSLKDTHSWIAVAGETSLSGEALDAALRDGDRPPPPLPSCIDPGDPPAHLMVRHAAGTQRRSYGLWSTDDPNVAWESSINRFTDEYQGEPLFERRSVNTGFRGLFEEAWELPVVTASLPMEREGQHLARFRDVRDELISNVSRVLQRLEQHFGQQ